MPLQIVKQQAFTSCVDGSDKVEVVLNDLPVWRAVDCVGSGLQGSSFLGGMMLSF